MELSGVKSKPQVKYQIVTILITLPQVRAYARDCYFLYVLRYIMTELNL